MQIITVNYMSLFSVSFGSSKGSMVETLVYETPTPLPDHAERHAFSAAAAAEFANAINYHHINGIHHPHFSQHHHRSGQSTSAVGGCASLDDSGIEISDE